jgi:hypothetical protein
MSQKTAGVIIGHFLIVIFFVLIYFYYLRSVMISLFYSYVTVSNKSSYVPVIEWGIVCIAAYLIYRDVRHHAKKSMTEDLLAGNWATHVQRIGANKKDVVEASRLIDSFVEYGSNGEIMAYLTSSLLKNKVNPSEIRETVGEIATYSESTPMFAKRWRWSKSKNEGIELRTKMIQSALDKASALTGLVRKDVRSKAQSKTR